MSVPYTASAKYTLRENIFFAYFQRLGYIRAMNTKTSFGRCLNLLLKKYRMRQTDLAVKASISQATISRIMTCNQAVDDQVAKSLCSAWPNRSDNIQLLIAGLSDVIRRWGFDPDSDVEVKPLQGVAHSMPTQAETDLAEIRAHLSDDVVSDLIHDLAKILRRADRHLYADTPREFLAGAVAEKPRKP